MALKSRLRSKRSERFHNVEGNDHSKWQEINLPSSDSESEDVSSTRKVREKYSAQRLMTGNRYYSVEGDHIYANAVSSGSIQDSLRKDETSEENNEKRKRKKCFSKNAVMARLNRERKKKYVLSLEGENKSLRRENERITKKMTIMKREILYLRGLLANSKELELILRNLREVTGLPVTSSIIRTVKTVTESPQKSSTTAEEDIKNLSEYNPKVRSVQSGYNYPILNKDINLGNCLCSSYEDMPNLESLPLHLENGMNDIYEQNINENFLSFSYQNLDLSLEECFNVENLSKQGDSEAGICLHVNQKRISVEICSICNNKATSTFQNHSAEGL